ncbi:MAG: hypothetical protein IJ426_02285 [Clostridia bacterium]|nr:hypothetical protein [Clostridia bacterium]
MANRKQSSKTFKNIKHHKSDKRGGIMSRVIFCSMCQKEINKGEEYWFIGDNYLQANYFDAPFDNIFCSEECLHECLFCEQEEFDGSWGENEDINDVETPDWKDKE